MTKNTVVSCWGSCKSTDAPIDVTIGQWFNNKQYKDMVLAIRKTKSKKKRTEMKTEVPCVAVGGKFSGRGSNNLLEFSNLIAIDIDGQDNAGVNMEKAKPAIMKMDAMYCSLSIGGEGLFSVFKVPDMENYSGYYKQISAVMAENGIKADNGCGDISRLRYYSWDPNPRYNWDAPMWVALPPPKVYYSDAKKVERIATPGVDEKVQACLQMIDRLKIDICKPEPEWYVCACSIASEYQEDGRRIFHQVSRYHEDYDSTEANAKYDNALKATGYSIGTFFLQCKNANILYRNNTEISCENRVLSKMVSRNPVLSKLVRTYDLRSPVDGKGFAV